MNITKWIFNPFMVKKPGQMKVVALCIAVATTFWFLNAFNKTYTTTFSYPITYKYDSEKFTPVSKLNQNISISLTGQGWDLLKEAFGEEKQITVSPNKLPGEGFVNPNNILDSTKEMLGKFQVNRIFADSIKYSFDYKVSKLLNLHLPQDSIKLENGYAIVSEIELTPNQVHITGAAKILDTIPENFIVTLNEEIDDDFDDEILLYLPDKVTAETTEINVSFEIQPYIEVIKKARVEILNNKDTNIIFKPENLDLRIYTTEKYKDSVNDSTFVYQLNLKKFKFEKDTFLFPKLTTKTPSFIKRIMLEDSTIYVTKP